MLAPPTAKAQGNCPPNIGFEMGNLSYWETWTGRIFTDGKLGMNKSNPVASRHKLLQNSNQQVKDFYGGFPVNCPNGSGYSMRLGNDSIDAQAERLSYTFSIPAARNNYSIVYHYAVVLQNPEHQDFQQPRFTSRIFNVTDNHYVDCAGFDFTASGDLPDFQLSKQGENVFYKSWSPITINLFGYAGKTLRLEFTTNDCAAGAHFGYAYLDVNENCTTPLSGSVLCENRDVVTLTAPYGFKEYHWYNADFSQKLGTGNLLKIFPAVPGAGYAVEIVPYPGLGCLDTLRTTIERAGEPFQLQVKDSVMGCATPGVDLTAASVTAGSSNGLFFSYYTDNTLQQFVPVPKQAATGLYYIKGENASGCTDSRPVQVIADKVKLVITDPPAVCYPGPTDITGNLVTAGSDPGLYFRYWKNAEATISASSPRAITEPGTYYVQGFNPTGCYSIEKLNVRIDPAPAFTVTDPPAVIRPTKVDLRNTIQASTDYQYSFWRDALLTSPLQGSVADSSGVYYIKGTSAQGCSQVLPVQVIVNPPINPPNVFSPNQDGVYDVWRIPSLQQYPACLVEVFDRYGRAVFRSSGYTRDWDGKDARGRDLPQGTYYYVITLSTAIKPIGGSVTIIR
ncbi:MAG: gliding motility-associated C-terminal domain-containing protein [Bacteroidota bacterium]|nr:gliding motility-associated C-terminal domain-containing protein [Bacteroidota bacterium]